jgi:hypothetical protein
MTTSYTKEAYQRLVAEYDRLLSFACEISKHLSNRLIWSARLAYSDTVFTKLVHHGVSLRKIVPDFSSEHELWDIGSACAIARCLIEAYDALAYISFDDVSDSERDFRIALWELNEVQHRLTMLDRLKATGPDVDAMRADEVKRQQQVIGHTFFNSLSEEVRGKINPKKAKAFYQTQSARNAINGIDHDFYVSIEMFLSQYVHTLPMALSQLKQARSRDSGSLELLATSLTDASLFLAKAIDGMASIWLDVGEAISGDFRAELDKWLDIAKHGPASTDPGPPKI